MATTLSVCLIARNEARTIARALDSVSEVASQRIVVDTGSTDGTPEAAREAGAEVHAFPWVDDFSAARNASLAHATGDWILVLDADEWLAPESIKPLRRCLGDARTDAWRVLQRNLQPPGELLRWEDTPVTRLFRHRPQYRYTGRIHEQVAPAIQAAGGRVAESAIVLMHDGYQQTDVQGGIDRRRRNLALLERAAATSPDDAYLLLQLGVTLKSVGRTEDAEETLRRAWAMETQTPSLGRALRETLHTRLSQLALGRKDATEALRHADAALQFAEDNAIALQVQALARLETGDAAGALRSFERLMKDKRLASGPAADFAAVATALRRMVRR